MQTAHCSAQDIAAYLDGHGGPSRRLIEAHCGACDECRAELIEVAGILDTGSPHRRSWLVALATAAAVALMVMRSPDTTGIHRESEVLESRVPSVVAPAGEVSSLERLVWTRVAGADRYRVAVFDSGGRLLWEATTPDTFAQVSSELATRVRGRDAHFWSVRARVGWDRWTESLLTEFRLTGDPRGP